MDMNLYDLKPARIEVQAFRMKKRASQSHVIVITTMTGGDRLRVRQIWQYAASPIGVVLSPSRDCTRRSGR